MYSARSAGSTSSPETPTRSRYPRNPDGQAMSPGGRSSNRARWPVTLLPAALTLALAASAGAAMQVNGTTGCTLADAIEAANTAANVGGCIYDEPVVELTQETDYDVDDGVLPFIVSAGKTITIRGVGGGTASTIRRVEDADPTTDPSRLFRVKGALVLSNLTLTGGYQPSNRGGAVKVFQSGTLELRSCRLSGNATGVDGGAVSSWGKLIVRRSTFDGNSAASAGGDGGAVYVANGTADIENSTFSGNVADQGGALAVVGGSATVDGSTFKGNTASLLGSAISVEPGLSVTVERSALAGPADLCYGAVTSNGNNAAEDTSCGLGQAGDQQNVALHLSDLVDTHGGAAPVHVPLCPWTGPNGECDSPLIERYDCRGQAESCDPEVWDCQWIADPGYWEWPQGVEVLRDQRDQFPRKDTANPLGQGDRCDVGAYESICSSGHESVGSYFVGLVGGQTGPSSGMVLNNGGCSSEDVGFGGQASECSIVWYRYGGAFEYKNVWFLRQSCLDQNFDGGRGCFSDPEGCKDTCAFNPDDAADFSAFTDAEGEAEFVRPAQILPAATYVLDVPGCTWSAPDGETTASLRSVIELEGGVLDYWDPEIIPPNPD